ncbi:MAG: polysaccharide deacetylase family protein [Actinomycetota bacterium]
MVAYPADRRTVGDWLQGAAAVVVLRFDVDAEVPILAEDERYAGDLSAMTHQSYSPRVGVLRILESLARHGVEATFFVLGITAGRWPRTAEEILAAGHEMALHGHSHVVLPGMHDEEQRRDLEAGIEGSCALGWSPKGTVRPIGG